MTLMSAAVLETSVRCSGKQSDTDVVVQIFVISRTRGHGALDHLHSTSSTFSHVIETSDETWNYCVMSQ